MESVASINEPSRATSSPSSGYLLGSMLDALRLSFSNTNWNCSSPRSLIASEKLLFLMPSSGAMFSRAKSSCSRTCSIWRAETCSSRWKKTNILSWSSKVILSGLSPRDLSTGVWGKIFPTGCKNWKNESERNFFWYRLNDRGIIVTPCNNS